MLTTKKLTFTAYVEKVLRCTCNVLVKSEYIEYKYKYMTHKLYEYEYFKNAFEYRVLPPQVCDVNQKTIRMQKYQKNWEFPGRHEKAKEKDRERKKRERANKRLSLVQNKCQLEEY